MNKHQRKRYGKNSDMKLKKTIIWTTSIFVICVICVFVTQPILIKAVFAKYKSTDHFLVLQSDTRINYEESAKGNALTLSNILSNNQKSVENILKAPFKKSINVYICASQEVFNEYVFLSKNVRGAVYWGKLFLSPGAFNKGSLAKLTSHELTHYLFYSHLGEKAHIKGIPLWFREGIAEFVANDGSSYTKNKSVSKQISSSERNAYLAGNTDFWFFTENPADAVTNNGVANWVLYRVGALFVHFIHDTKPDSFDQLIQLLLSGVEFNEALKMSYHKTTKSLLQEFTYYLT